MQVEIISEEIYTLKFGGETSRGWRKVSTWNGISEYRNDDGEKVIIMEEPNLLEKTVGNPNEHGHIIKASPTILAMCNKAEKVGFKLGDFVS